MHKDTRIKCIWETGNKEFAEEFKATQDAHLQKIDPDYSIVIEEINLDEV